MHYSVIDRPLLAERGRLAQHSRSARPKNHRLSQRAEDDPKRTLIDQLLDVYSKGLNLATTATNLKPAASRKVDERLNVPDIRVVKSRFIANSLTQTIGKLVSLFM